ncbi:hypothetical protein [Kitasatospora sp. NPDC093558]
MESWTDPRYAELVEWYHRESEGTADGTEQPFVRAFLIPDDPE